MSRPRKPMPEYKYHVSGQARVYIDGKYFYLGPYDSAESWAKYRRLVGAFIATGRLQTRMPSRLTRPSPWLM